MPKAAARLAAPLALAVLAACGTFDRLRGREAPATPPAAAASAALVPPDGRWRVDDLGRRYYLHEVPRVPGGWAWANEQRTRVRLLHGIEMDVESADDRRFLVKVYETKPVAPPASREPQGEARERILESYRPRAEEGDAVVLRPFDDGLPRRGQWRNGFDVADVNGDGHPDIVFGPPRKGRRAPVVFLGDGSGRWRPWREASFPNLPFEYGDAAAGDLDGDGDVDLVFACHLRGVVALVGDGRGRFTEWSRGIDFAAGGETGGFSSRAVELADADGDGRLDVVALGEGPQLAGSRGAAGAPDVRTGARGAVVWRSRGDGSWERRVASPGPGFGGSLAAGHLDGDGRTDFAVGSDRMGSKTILLRSRAEGGWQPASVAEARPRAVFRAVALADFDGDGRLDLAMSYLSHELGTFRTGIDVLLARASGFERRALAVVEGNTDVHALDAGDLDGDGDADLVGADGDGQLWIFRGDGKGGFERPPAPDLGTTERCQAYGLRLADLDGDGADEIVAAFAEEPITQGPYGEDRSCPSQGALRAWKLESPRGVFDR